MGSSANRFVVLEHQPGPKSSRGLHWDLMLEHEDSLLTWALEKEPRWLLLTAKNNPVALMPAADLARYMQSGETKDPVDLHEIPATRQDVTGIDFQATLQEAVDRLDSKDTEALYVTRKTIPGISRIYGIVTRSDIDRYYTLQ